MRRSSFRRYRPKPPVNYRPDFLRYEELKRAWVTAHPEATPEEYTAAMRRIAEDCGI